MPVNDPTLKTAMTADEADNVTAKLQRMRPPTTAVKALLRGKLGQVIQHKIAAEGWTASDAVAALTQCGYRVSLREMKAALRACQAAAEKTAEPGPPAGENVAASAAENAAEPVPPPPAPAADPRPVRLGPETTAA